jgi:hypothetical protein
MDILNDFDDFDAIMNDINQVYDDLECEYKTYIKTLQIVPYKPVDFTLITYLNCISTYFNFFQHSLK